MTAERAARSTAIPLQPQEMAPELEVLYSNSDVWVSAAQSSSVIPLFPLMIMGFSQSAKELVTIEMEIAIQDTELMG